MPRGTLSCACALVDNDIDSPLVLDRESGILSFERKCTSEQSWAIIGFVAVVLIAAAIDAVFFRSSCHLAFDSGTTSEASDAPPCRSNQLKLRINRGGSPEPPRHEDYVTLNHIRGGVCSFSRRQTRIWIFTPDGPGERGVLEVGPGSDLSGTYGPSLGGQLFRFRYSPGCRQTGPGPLARASKLGTSWPAGKSGSTPVEANRLRSGRRHLCARRSRLRTCSCQRHSTTAAAPPRKLLAGRRRSPARRKP